MSCIPQKPLNSYILRSKMLKKYIVYIVVGIIVSIFLNRLYMAKAEPGCLFFSQCFEQTENWERTIRQKSRNCFIFAGGSEVRMGIEPQTMWDTHGIPVINAGGQAANGIRCNVQAALRFLQPGDTLVLSINPGALNLRNNGITHTGINFCYNHYGNLMFTEGIIPFNMFSFTKLITGNVNNLSIHLMRILTRPECIYRYSSPANALINNRGRVEVLLTQQQSQELLPFACCSKQDFSGGDVFLRDVKEYCDAHNIRLIVYMSRSHQHETWRRFYAQGMLYVVEQGILVLKDEYLGAWPDGSKYSDTSLHLSIDGGKEFSEFIARQIKTENYWTKEELQRIVNGTE